MEERKLVRLCPVRLCVYRFRNKDGLRAHLYTKHKKEELYEVLGKAQIGARPSERKSQVVEAVLGLIFP